MPPRRAPGGVERACGRGKLPRARGQRPGKATEVIGWNPESAREVEPTSHVVSRDKMDVRR
jgi:hypothetical protein